MTVPAFEDVEGMRIALAQAGPIPNSVLYNNAKALAKALTDAGITLGGSSIPVGAIMDFSGASAPTGWLLANGDTIPNGTGTVQGVTANFSSLYSVIGSTYGVAGKLPDLRSRVAVGRGTMGATAGASNRLNGVFASPDQLGATGGDQYLQSHGHNLNGAASVDTCRTDHTHEYATRVAEYYNDAQLGGSGVGGLGNYNYPSSSWSTWQHPVAYVGCGIQNYTATAYNGSNYVSQTTARVAQMNYGGSSTLNISVSANGSGGSQNVQPTILLNKIIRYL